MNNINDVFKKRMSTKKKKKISTQTINMSGSTEKSWGKDYFKNIEHKQELL